MRRGTSKGLTPALGKASIRRTSVLALMTGGVHTPQFLPAWHWGFAAGLISLHSSLPEKSFLVSFPLLCYMLKFNEVWIEKNIFLPKHWGTKSTSEWQRHDRSKQSLYRAVSRPGTRWVYTFFKGEKKSINFTYLHSGGCCHGMDPRLSYALKSRCSMCSAIHIDSRAEWSTVQSCSQIFFSSQDLCPE